MESIGEPLPPGLDFGMGFEPKSHLRDVAYEKNLVDGIILWRILYIFWPVRRFLNNSNGIVGVWTEVSYIAITVTSLSEVRQAVDV